MIYFLFIYVCAIILACIGKCDAFTNSKLNAFTGSRKSNIILPNNAVDLPHNYNKCQSYGHSLILRRGQPYRDILGLGAPEIAFALIAGLLLFGPETLKSLSKDVGKAAAELKEIPKTFQEGLEEGAESAQVAKMKAIAAEKRKKRDAKLAKKDVVEDEEEDEVDDDE